MAEEVIERLRVLKAELKKIKERSSTCPCEYAKAAYHLFHAAISECWGLTCTCCNRYEKKP